MPRNSHQTAFRIAALAISAGLAASTSAADATYRVVARTGQAAPGGGLFSDLGAPVISPGGRVAFKATLTGGLGPSGVWSEGIAGLNNLALVARQGDPIPGVANTFIGSLTPNTGIVIMNAFGELAFAAEITGDQEQFGEVALLTHTANGVDTLAAPGQLVSLPCQGFGCTRWLTDIHPSSLAFNTAGQIAFHSTIAGTGVHGGNDQLVLRADTDTIEVIMREGDVPPGTFDVTYSGSSGNHPHINDNGEVLIRNYLAADNETAYYWSVWRGEPGDMSLIVAQGWTTPMGGHFWSMSIGGGGMGFNNAGQTLFVQAAEFDEDDRRTGLWLQEDAPIEAICFEGMAAPGGFDYVAVDAFTGQINTHGDMLFHAQIAGPGVTTDSDDVLVRRLADGSSEIIVRQGDQAPGFLNGVHFVGIGWAGETILNDGRVAFRAELAGPGIHEGNNDSLWITRPGADPALLIREGQTMVLGGALRNVESFFTGLTRGPETGHAGGVSQLGQIAIRIGFTDGTEAIVVASPRSACPGDVNGDGVVNFTDLNLLVDAFNDEGDVVPADLDLDGDVDFNDLNTLLGNFNAVCS